MSNPKYKKPNVRAVMKKACKIAGGKAALAQHLGVAYQSMDGWGVKNEMPATEFNGKTFYSLRIQELTAGQVTITDLLGFIPHPQQWAIDAGK